MFSIIRNFTFCQIKYSSPLRYQKHKLHSSPIYIYISFPIININQTYKITRYIIIYNENNLKFSLKQKITKFSLKKNIKILSVEQVLSVLLENVSFQKSSSTFDLERKTLELSSNYQQTRSPIK